MNRHFLAFLVTKHNVYLVFWLKSFAEVCVCVASMMHVVLVTSCHYFQGGCVDSTNQSLALLYMTLGQQDVSKVLLGPLSPYT